MFGVLFGWVVGLLIGFGLFVVLLYVSCLVCYVITNCCFFVGLSCFGFVGGFWGSYW